MSVRKKKLIGMVAGVFLCSLIVLCLSEYAIRSDRDEYAKKCQAYEGIWKSEKGDFSLEIHRVSSGYLFFSMENGKVYRKVRLMTAHAVGDDMYEFSYAADQSESGRVYKVYAGQEGKGTIQLQENKIKIDIPPLQGKRKALEYNGVLTKKAGLSKQKPYHLADYLGTKKKLEGELAGYCSFGYDDQGKIWRVHALLAENGEYYKTDIAGISMNSSLEECREQLGEMTSEIELASGQWRRQYESSAYVSTIITNGFGVIKELDCQIANPDGMTRQGDFLMKGDTVYRYAGDYSQGKTIELPGNTRRIASHAFDAGEHGYKLARYQDRQICSIDIPKGVAIEEDAFASCGPLDIYLKEGWKEIPKGAFAHMVSKDSIETKHHWVNIVLPSSVEKIGENAFSLDEGKEELDRYWEDVTVNESPVIISTPSVSLQNVTYIGDNAFWGIAMSKIPSNVRYLGVNFTIYSICEEDINIPDHLTTLKKNNLYLLGEGGRIMFPAGMKEIEDGAIRGESMDWFQLGNTPKNTTTYY